MQTLKRGSGAGAGRSGVGVVAGRGGGGGDWGRRCQILHKFNV